MLNKKKDLIRLFGVEHLVTPKTLISESAEDIARKSPNDASWDIRALLDELTIRVASKDIFGCIDCLDAIQRRIDYMQKVAEEIRKTHRK